MGGLPAERAARSTRQIESLVKTIQADTSEAISSMERETLLKRVVSHPNERPTTLDVQNVHMGSDPDFAIPYRFE